VNSKHSTPETPKSFFEQVAKVYAKIALLGVYGDHNDLRAQLRDVVGSTISVSTKIGDDMKPVFTIGVPDSYGMPSMSVKPEDMTPAALARYQGEALKRARRRIYDNLRMLSEAYSLSQENAAEFLTELGYASLPEETSTVAITIPQCNEYPTGKSISFRMAGHADAAALQPRAEELAGPLTSFSTKLAEAFPEAQDIAPLKVSVSVGHRTTWPAYKEDDAS
jgi:hypothetical protein